MSDCSVELKNIHKHYPGVHALSDVDIKLYPGNVHCLVGENGSGKSTLIKILSGVENPDVGGEIYIDNIKQQAHNCESALLSGVQVVYQDISLFPNLTVAENIAFRHYINRKNSLINWKEIEHIATEALQQIGIDIDLYCKVETLSIAQQQLIEIARSLTGRLKLLILDEPTASLTKKEVNALFVAIEKIKSKGVSVLFVSHKLNEIFEIAERVSVLRDGVIVGQHNPNELNNDTLSFLMTGKKAKNAYPSPFDKENECVLEVSKLSKKFNYKNINFKVIKGEILGITGLLGSGRTELALSLFGMNEPDSGDVYIEGKKESIKSSSFAKKKGIAYVSENRRDLGLVQEQSIENNIVVTILNKFLNKYRFLNNKHIENHSNSYIKNLGVKLSSDIHAKVNTLSGGNQQKIVLAKWLSTSPKLLILDEPTIGIDIIAKSNIHQLIKTMAEQGMGIIMISDEIQEVLDNCHRVLVMDKGEIIHEFVPKEETEADLLKRFNLA